MAHIISVNLSNVTGEIRNGEHVEFVLNNYAKIYGEIVHSENHGWFVSVRDDIFDIIGVNKLAFVKRAVGYTPTEGYWPFVKSVNDLRRVLTALEKYRPNDAPKQDNKEEKKPFALEIYRRRTIHLNFKL